MPELSATNNALDPDLRDDPAKDADTEAQDGEDLGPYSSSEPVVFAEGVEAILEGSIEEIVFRNEREGFTVAKFRLTDGRSTTIVGPIASAPVGESICVSGDFVREPRFGLQFKLVDVIDTEASEEVARAYLSSGLLPYIGQKAADEIVAACGADTLHRLAVDPGSLVDYRGITARRLPAIRRALRETLHLAPVIGLLGAAIEKAQTSGIDARKLPITVSRKVKRRYGPSASQIIRANPWRLAKEIAGVGFRSADNIAIGLGCPFDSPIRMEAAVLEAMRDAAREEGHITCPASIIEAESARLTGRSTAEAREAITRLVESGEIVATSNPDGFALPHLAEAERLIAAKLRVISDFVDATPISVSEDEIDEVERNENAALAAFSRFSDTTPGAVAAPTSMHSGATPSGTTETVPEPGTEPGGMGPAPLMESHPSARPEVFRFDLSQRRAIRKALEDRITIITGGPGTGKTTIVRAVLDLADSHHLSSALVSPTGRAAKRLSEATGRPAQTIHRFLRFKPQEGFQGPETLPDVLVIDEASMLDSPLAAALFGSLASFTRLILVGDEDQLPAVGPGNVLADLLGAPMVSVLRLTQIHRTGAGSGIPELARQIKAGVRKPNYDRVTTRFIPRGNDQSLEPAQRAAEIAAWVGETAASYAERFDEFQVLCPMSRGGCGTKALNQLIQGIVNPGPHAHSVRREGFTLYPGDRILVTKNDYETGLFNGDVGRILGITADGTLATMFDGVERTLPPDAGGGFVLAYAMSIHKAQGSEFPIVIVPMSTGFYKMLERRLLYTAISRASSTVAIVGQAKAVSMAIGNHDPRSRRTLLPGYLAAKSLPPAVILRPSDVPDDELF